MLLSNASATLSGGSIRGCTAGQGGAIFAQRSAVSLTARFGASGNWAEAGGVVSARGGSEVRVEDGAMRNNRATRVDWAQRCGATGEEPCSARQASTKHAGFAWLALDGAGYSQVGAAKSVFASSARTVDARG